MRRAEIRPLAQVHLDLRAKDVLLEALRKYTGTVVFVSHDRYFIDNLATRVFEIGGGEVHDYPGNYEDYQWQKSGHPARPDVANAETRSVAPADANGHRSTEEPDGPAKKLNPILVRRMENRGEELEAAIARAEAEIASCELDLANFRSAEESIRLSRRIEELRHELDEMVREWGEIEMSLDESAGQS